MQLRIAGIIPESVVDAPGGISYTIFSQGCIHNCQGCHNPNTHSLHGGQVIDCSFIFEDIKRYPLSKIITFSGGEPFLQPEEFAFLAKRINSSYRIVAYTGFLFEDLLKEEKYNDLMNQLDLLIDGPYIEKLKDISLRFRGSSNQRLIDVKRSLLTGNTEIINI